MKPYYHNPFGLTQKGYNNLTTSLGSAGAKKYQYNGKLERSGNPDLSGELQDDYGLDLYDYGARFYDAGLGRFFTIDPLANKYAFQSPYVYANNNPIRLIDKNGKSGQEPDKPTKKAQQQFQKMLSRFYQVQSYRNSVARKILIKQGVPVNNITVDAAGRAIKINPKFKTVGGFGNSKTSTVLIGGTLSLNVPKTKSNGKSGVLGALASEAGSEFTSYKLGKWIPKAAGIISRSVNMTSFLLLSPENASGPSLTDMQKAKNELQQKEAINAVIKYFSNFLKMKTENYYHERKSTSISIK